MMRYKSTPCNRPLDPNRSKPSARGNEMNIAKISTVKKLDEDAGNQRLSSLNSPKHLPFGIHRRTSVRDKETKYELQHSNYNNYPNHDVLPKQGLKQPICRRGVTAAPTYDRRGKDVRDKARNELRRVNYSKCDVPTKQRKQQHICLRPVTSSPDAPTVDRRGQGRGNQMHGARETSEYSVSRERALLRVMDARRLEEERKAAEKVREVIDEKQKRRDWKSRHRAFVYAINRIMRTAFDTKYQQFLHSKTMESGEQYNNAV